MKLTGARFALVLLLNSIVFQFHFPVVLSDDEADHLLQGLNSFRQSVNVPALSKHDNAGCLADRIADDLEDRKCNSSLPATTEPLSSHPKALSKCNVDVNSTGEAIVLPVCMPDRVATLVLTNYTHSPVARYVNDSRFTGAGIGTEDDWTVLVLTTSTTAGNLVSSSRPGIASLGGVPAVVMLVLWLLM